MLYPDGNAPSQSRNDRSAWRRRATQQQDSSPANPEFDEAPRGVACVRSERRRRIGALAGAEDGTWACRYRLPGPRGLSCPDVIALGHKTLDCSILSDPVRVVPAFGTLGSSSRVPVAGGRSQLAWLWLQNLLYAWIGKSLPIRSEGPNAPPLIDVMQRRETLPVGSPRSCLASRVRAVRRGLVGRPCHVRHRGRLQAFRSHHRGRRVRGAGDARRPVPSGPRRLGTPAAPAHP